MAIIAYSFVIAALLLFPQICASSAKEALLVWGTHIVPSLFPYMIFTQMLSRQIQKTSCPPLIVCAVLGVFGGSPSGAVCIRTYQAALSKKMTLALFALTGVISPMFFLGTVRLFTGNPLFSRRLLASQWIGALFSALIVLLFHPASIEHRSDVSIKPPHEDALSQSIDAILHVGGCIICFSVLAGLLSLLPLPETLRSLLHALLEISGGTHAMIQCSFSSSARAILLAFATGFGSFSIFFQNLRFLKEAQTGFCLPFFIALLRGFLSAAAMRILLIF